MKIYSAHTAKRSQRHLIASLLMIIYLVIALSPLAPLALHSRVVAHAVTGECSGDCNVCGCSQQSRANQTCCCAKKKQRQAGAAKLSAGDCCSKKPAPVPVVAQSDCCSKAEHDDHAQDYDQEATPPKSEVVYKCGCPCGKSKLPALAGTGSTELLPYYYSERILLPHEDTHYPPLPHRMASRHGEPPDPPPKLSLNS